MGIKLILTVIIVVGLSRPADLNAEPLPSEQQQSSVRKEYGHLLVENLEKLKRYPTVLTGMRAEGTVLVFFTVNREGKITRAKYRRDLAIRYWMKKRYPCLRALSKCRRFLQELKKTRCHSRYRLSSNPEIHRLVHRCRQPTTQSSIAKN